MDLDNDTSDFFLRENLRALRKRMNWSQCELADKIGLNRGNIASYENGTAEPKICNLVKLANLFRISVFDLTHSNLREEESYQNASRRSVNGEPVMQELSLERYDKEAKDFESAIKGMQCMFRLKINNLDEIPEDLQFINNHFEQLHSIALHLLNSHVELISLINNQCKDHE